jgi:uncharacterized cupredoxin-like copper-binding protein
VRLRAFLVTSAAVLAGGCGADDQSTGAAGAVATVPEGRPLRVVAREYSFTPARARTSAARPLRIELDNRGSLAHNLKLFQGDRELGGTPTFQSGARTASVRLPAGSYRMVCTVGNHEELGMVGELEVSGR